VALAFSEACERNKQPILEALKPVLPGFGSILEIGSGTGQHVVFFAPRFPHLTWQPSDRATNLPGLRERLRLEGRENIRPAVELDVLGRWPQGRFEAAYSANTAHIMAWPEVRAMFAGVSACLMTEGVFCLYGPFNREGKFTSASNEEFDLRLRARDASMGIRDIGDLASLAASHHMELEQEFALPANNQLLVFRKRRGRNPGGSNNE
jgi:cyclopropane fatty-acyl-phospholipid synthase-like methyltransferase